MDDRRETLTSAWTPEALVSRCPNAFRTVWLAPNGKPIGTPIVVGIPPKPIFPKASSGVYLSSSIRVSVHRRNVNCASRFTSCRTPLPVPPPVEKTPPPRYSNVSSELPEYRCTSMPPITDVHAVHPPALLLGGSESPTKSISACGCQ